MSIVTADHDACRAGPKHPIYMYVLIYMHQLVHIYTRTHA